MIRPASYLPAATAAMIWSNGTTSYSKPPGSSSRSVRNAVVIVPGTAILTFFRSSTRHRPAGDDHRAVAVAHAAARSASRAYLSSRWA